ncbi:MAG: UbiA family prenyltransferase [Planctomycetia bacterium]|nr:UbiA family prenyltransferase [Planctomycetia bacterium]
MAIKPYLQLVRLPNVFTAAADSLAGWLLVEGSLRDPDQWLPLVLASAFTYAGGIVLNDVFDYEVDRVERPGRPLPSGQVGRGFAAGLGVGMLAAGLALSVVSKTLYGWAVESALIGCILAYDGGLKRSPLGPEVMGACRGLNLLLGMSRAARLGGPVGWLVAVAYAVFVAGITWVSRSEVHTGLTRNIRVGMALQAAAFLGFVVACVSPGRFPHESLRPIPGGMLAPVFLAGLAAAVLRKTFLALRQPTPEWIQPAVKFGIMSLVWIHAGLLLGVRGLVPSLLVALFWIPAAYVGRWVYST